MKPIYRIILFANVVQLSSLDGKFFTYKEYKDISRSSARRLDSIINDIKPFEVRTPYETEGISQGTAIIYQT